MSFGCVTLYTSYITQAQTQHNGPITLTITDLSDTINSLCFSPNRYWLCAATGPAIKIWDLESKNQVEELKPEVSIVLNIIFIPISHQG